MRAQSRNLFRKTQITEDKKLWNKAVSKVRGSAQWFFVDIVSYFKLYDSHKTVLVGVVASRYIASVFFPNARSWFYSSVTSKYFGL